MTTNADDLGDPRHRSADPESCWNADDLAEMKMRVADLERRLGKWRRIFFALTSVVVLMTCTVVAFLYRDSDGVMLGGEDDGARVLLGLTRDGSGLLSLSDSTSTHFLEAAEYRGWTVLRLAAIDPGQGAAIQLCDKDWSPRAELKLDEDGGVDLSLDMPRGRILVGEDAHGAPRIQILDEGGEVAWSAP